MMLLLITFLCLAVANPVEKWVHSEITEQSLSQESSVAFQRMQRQMPKLEKHSFLLQEEGVAQDDVLANIQFLLPVLDVDVKQAPHLKSFLKHEQTSFEWFSYDEQKQLNYTWLLVEQTQPETYSLIVATGQTSEVDLEAAPMQAVRISFPENDVFGNAAFPVLHSELPKRDMSLLMDSLRYTEARIMLGHSSPHKKALNMRLGHKGKRIIPQIMAITSAIDAITSTWQGIVAAFGSSTTQTIERVVGLGFEKYNQKTQLLKAFGVPKTDIGKFTKSVTTAMGIPQNSQTSAVFMAMEFTTSMTWLEDEFLYTEKATGNKATTLMIYKFGDAASNMADFLFVKVQSDFALADDLLYVTTSKSTLGGLFSSTKTKIERIPHILSLKDAEILQTFFKVVAIGKLADDLGVKFEWPDLPSKK